MKGRQLHEGSGRAGGGLMPEKEGPPREEVSPWESFKVFWKKKRKDSDLLTAKKNFAKKLREP